MNQGTFKTDPAEQIMDSLISSATTEVMFHMLIKLMPEEKHEYWRDQKQRAIRQKMIHFFSADPNDAVSQNLLSEWKTELAEIEARLKPKD